MSDTTQGWIAVTPETLPFTRQIVWIKRKNSIYIGHRLNKPVSIHKDISQECWWYGCPFDDFKSDETDSGGIRLYSHFNDQTVIGWMPIELPTQPKQ